MDETLTNPHDVLTRRLKAARQAVDDHVRAYKRSDFWLLLFSIVLGAVGTVLAGGAASVGQPALEVFGGWRILCALVAMLTGLSTVAAGLHKAFHVSDRLGEALACLAKLNALELDLDLKRRSPEAVATDYQEVLERYPAYVTA